MINKKYLYNKCPLALVLLGMSFIADADTSAQITYSGNLVALPCSIEPGMDNLYIDMGITDTKSLYRYTRTAAKEIQFVLGECDPKVYSTISAIFSGPTTTEGLLMFTPDSTAKGAGIGLEYLDGRPIGIGDGKSYAVPLREGNMTIRLKAYVQAESMALANKTITPGIYNAVLTYTLSYE